MTKLAARFCGWQTVVESSPRGSSGVLVVAGSQLVDAKSVPKNAVTPPVLDAVLTAVLERPVWMHRPSVVYTVTCDAVVHVDSPYCVTARYPVEITVGAAVGAAVVGLVVGAPATVVGAVVDGLTVEGLALGRAVVGRLVGRAVVGRTVEPVPIAVGSAVVGLRVGAAVVGATVGAGAPGRDGADVVGAAVGTNTDVAGRVRTDSTACICGLSKHMTKAVAPAATVVPAGAVAVIVSLPCWSHVNVYPEMSATPPVTGNAYCCARKKRLTVGWFLLMLNVVTPNPG